MYCLEKLANAYLHSPQLSLKKKQPIVCFSLGKGKYFAFIVTMVAVPLMICQVEFTKITYVEGGYISCLDVIVFYTFGEEN